MTQEIEKQATEILKQDRMGRVRTPAARREALLEEFERSGMSGSDFAAFTGVKYQTFASWVQKRRRQREEQARATSPEGAAPQSDANSMRWVEAHIGAGNGSNSPGLIIELPGGARIEVRNGGQALLAAELLRGLGAGRRTTSC